jgi:FtsH ternary system domain X7
LVLGVMALRFPTLDTLKLALTSEGVPAEVAAAPVEGAIEVDGEVVIFQDLKAAVTKRLSAIGAEEAADTGQSRQRFPNWLALIPLVRSEPHLSDKTAVLFDVAGGEPLAEVVAEMLRLGNDRQSFRHLSDDQTPRTLLRVLGPPYYTLLRSLESDGTRSLPAFAEQQPRVWVELGYQHPLANRIQLPAGKWLLLRSPRHWELLEEGPFHDVYQAVEFQLPTTASAWNDQPLANRITVPLRLTSMAKTDSAELWVLEENAWQQIEQLVAHSDNELINRLAFAVVDPQLGQASSLSNEAVVILRVRPSKLPPPVLILQGVACRSYLNLPNLFVPVGRRLHPPLRRDAVSKLLVTDASRLFWLQPLDKSNFIPRSVPDAAFRPLSQWVDYVLAHEHEPLTAWMAAHRFDFASFVCHDESAPRTKPPKQRPDRTAEPRDAGPATVPSNQSVAAEEEPILAEIVETDDDPTAELARVAPQPSELQRRLSAVERRFLELDAPLDSAARGALWQEMAWLNGALDRRLDAALCWSHVLWEQKNAVDGERARGLADWSDHGQAGFPSPAELQELLDDPAPQRLSLTRLATQLVGQAAYLPNNAITPEQLALAARVLSQHDSALPIRLAWLAWVALARLSHHDDLALARARDRLLERLFERGLTAEHDLPGFLRAGSGADADRHRVLRERLLSLREIVAEWLPADPTRIYADLIFAYGLAQLGEAAESQRIVTWARQQLGSRDPLHRWALAAYEFRIAEAVQAARRSQLSPELLSALEGMERVERYKADRLRQHSRIIEPYERIDPYRRWHRHYADDLSKELALLFDLTDRDQLLTRLNGLLSSPPAAARSPAGRVRLLTTALELSPRLGEQFAAGVLSRVSAAWDATEDVVERALLLEKALQVAAHYDQREAVQAFVERFERALPEVVRSYLHLQTEHSPERQEKLVTIESLFQQSLRGLRKLGLRDEIGRMFGQIVSLVHAESSQTPAKPRKGARPAQRDETRAAKLLLAVAGGWFYFGQHEQARPAVEEVRQQLFHGGLPPIPKASLACAYVSAVGHASLDIALRLIQELFAQDAPSGKPNLPPISDTFTTSSHFSLTQIDIVEATVLTLVSDEFVLSPEVWRWLEEDEFLVRQRIHRDVRELVGRAAG